MQCGIGNIRKDRLFHFHKCHSSSEIVVSFFLCCSVTAVAMVKSEGEISLFSVTGEFEAGFSSNSSLLSSELEFELFVQTY